jgi:hypothetical protein
MKSKLLLGKAIAAFGVALSIVVWLGFMERTARPLMEKVALAVACVGAVRFYIENGVNALRARKWARAARNLEALAQLEFDRGLYKRGIKYERPESTPEPWRTPHVFLRPPRDDEK